MRLGKYEIPVLVTKRLKSEARKKENKAVNQEVGKGQEAKLKAILVK